MSQGNEVIAARARAPRTFVENMGYMPRIATQPMCVLGKGRLCDACTYPPRVGCAAPKNKEEEA